MNEFLVYTLYSSLAVHVVLLAFCVWKVWQGENVVDRLIGLELVGTLTMALLVITAVLQQRSLYLDVALGLVALSFIGMIALSRYIANEQMY